MITKNDKITVNFGENTVLIAGVNNTLTLYSTVSPVKDPHTDKKLVNIFEPEVQLNFSTAKSVETLISQLDLVRQYLVNKELTKELVDNIRNHFEEDLKEPECDCGQCPSDPVQDGVFLTDEQFDDALAGDEELT